MNTSMLSDALHSDACALKPRHHFDNIAISYITIFQVMTTDNWVNVMWDTFLMEGTLSFFLFPTVIVIGNYITMNIFLAILLSTFSAASKAGRSRPTWPPSMRRRRLRRRQRRRRPSRRTLS